MDDEKLAIGSVTEVDITIEVDFKRPKADQQGLKFEIGSNYVMNILMDVEKNQTQIWYHNPKKSLDEGGIARYVDIDRPLIDMKIFIYVDNTSITVHDTLSQLSKNLPLVSTIPYLTRGDYGKGVNLRKIVYAKNGNISHHDGHDENASKNRLSEIMKVTRMAQK